MGVVVAATHLQLEERFAIKFMLPWALSDQAAVERFAREARAAVRLKSVHVARVVDVGTLESGSPFMVMEFLEGSDVAALVQGHRQLPLDEAADIVLQACDAVAEAHSLGIVHRDLKPRNLFRVTGHDGNPLIKVLDFGISKMRGGPGADLSLTKTAEVIGSPSYMSPEQLRASRDVDERTDIWSLGVILHELLAGVVPFDAESVTQLTAMVLLENPRPIREVRPDVPELVERLIAGCLEKDASCRVQSVADLADVLDAFAPEHSRGLARRVRQVTETKGGRSIPPSSLAPGSVAAPKTGPMTPLSGRSNPPSRVPVTGGTSVSWSKTELAATPSTMRGATPGGDTRQVAPSSPTRWSLIALFMLAGTGLGVGVVLLYYSRLSTGPSPTAVASDSAAAAVVAAPAKPSSSESTTAMPPTQLPPATAASAAPAELATQGGHPPDPRANLAGRPVETQASSAPVPALSSKPPKTRPSGRGTREGAGSSSAPDDIPSDRR
jgi:eukaryotic-like serine/threonine-protein kinase